MYVHKQKLNRMRHMILAALLLSIICDAIANETVETKQASDTEVKANYKPLKKWQLQPHKAEYTIKLDRNNNPDIADVGGNMRIIIRDLGSGWAFEQHSKITITYNEQPDDIFTTSITSWEEHDGKNYRFDVVSHRNAEETLNISGVAKKRSDNKYKLKFYNPNRGKTELPSHVVFPLKHLRMILESISRKHEMSGPHLVFDGSNETLEPVEVNVLINPPFKPNIRANGPEMVDFSKAWTVTTGVFDKEDVAMDPDYETKQTILHNGIITSMNMNYEENSFTTRASLHKLEVFLKHVPVAQ